MISFIHMGHEYSHVMAFCRSIYIPVKIRSHLYEFPSLPLYYRAYKLFKKCEECGLSKLHTTLPKQEDNS